MLLVIYALLVLLGACVLLLMPTIWLCEIFLQYRDPRAVECPETHRQVAVRFNALRAAVSGLRGNPSFRLADCTRWPERGDCGQECVPEALRRHPFTAGETARPRTKQLYHLPVLLAAWVVWLLGVAWHSEFLFREPWRNALHLDPRSWLDVTEWLSPHLLSIGISLLFAYGVAALLVWTHQRGTWHGIVTAVGVWLVLGVAVLLTTGVRGIPPMLLQRELVFTLFGSVVVGAMVGGLEGRMTLRRT